MVSGINTSLCEFLCLFGLLFLPTACQWVSQISVIIHNDHQLKIFEITVQDINTTGDHFSYCTNAATTLTPGIKRNKSPETNALTSSPVDLKQPDLSSLLYKVP